MVIAWPWQFFDLFETLGFSDGAFEFLFLLELVIPDACGVLGDEVGPC